MTRPSRERILRWIADQVQRPLGEHAEKWSSNFWVALVLQIATAVTLVIIAPKLEDPSDTAGYVGWVALAVVLIGLPLMLAEYRKRVARSKADALTEMSAEHLAMISGYIDPALDVFRGFTAATDRVALGDLEGTYRSKLIETWSQNLIGRCPPAWERSTVPA